MTLPATMKAMVTMGHGGLDQMVLHMDWPRPPDPAPPGEVLIKVGGACGLNNTDVNTRTGWYSKAVSEATTGDAYDEVDTKDPTWGGGAPIAFPRIQGGADVCGTIVAVGDGVDPVRIGERVITDNWLRDPDDLTNKDKAGYFGSECDGGGMPNTPQRPPAMRWRSTALCQMQNLRPSPVPIPPPKAC